MKRFTILAAVAISASAAFAQMSKVTTAENALVLRQYENAKADIDIALGNAKSNTKVKTYIVASRVYSTLAAVDKDTEGDALVKSKEFIEKALELDAKGDAKGKGIGKEAKNIAKVMPELSGNAQNAGANAFNKKDYKAAMNAFIYANWCDQKVEGYTDVQDSVIFLNTAIAAMQAEEWETGYTYFDKCIDVDYDGPMSCLRANWCLSQAKADSARMESNLKKGFEKYPDNKDVLTTLIQYYLTAQRNAEALEYLNAAIAKDDSNPQFFFARGCLNEKLDIEAAKADYLKAIEMNPKFFNALYNLAVVYYNEGVNKVADASNERDQAKYDALIAESKVFFEKSVPYMLRAADNAEKVDDKISTLETVKNTYYRLNDNAKYTEIQDQINALKAAQ